MTVAEIGIHVRDGRAWAAPPSRVMVDRIGATMRDANGKPRWQPLITFASKELRDNWSKQVVDVVRTACPEALLDVAPELTI
jgi:hypothetical protein